MKLLLAEDTVDLNHVVTVMLEHDGFEVDSVFDGEAALQKVMEQSYDGAILDIMMPKRDGLSVLKEMRSRHILVPVLLLTAKAEVSDRVDGLEAGADDYLPKPFAMKELLARVRSMTRRRVQYDTSRLHYGDFSLNADSFELTGENTVRLAVKELELLQALVLNADKSLGTSWILEHVWGGDPEAGEDTVTLYISYLRNKLRSVGSLVRIDEDSSGYTLKSDAQTKDGGEAP